MEPIPFLDLLTPHRELEAELLQVFQKALNTANFIGGPMVENFERAFGQFCGAPYCIGVGSGTDALRFALIATGIGLGDTVITAPNTFIATTEAISQAGATPEFVDIDEQTYCLDPAKLSEYLAHECRRDSAGKLVSQRTRKRIAAVLPVHLYGQPADMDPILDLAERYGLLVIEDACQAHGAQYFSKKMNRWCMAGTMGQAAGFSFYPGKNLGACGDGGAITTNHEAVARAAYMIREHGASKKYYHEREGYTGRLDAIQAGFLTVKLAHLAGWNRSRQEAAARYHELFKGHATVTLPYESEWTKSAYHLFVVRVADREGLMKQLAEEGIGTGIHYPIPLHLQKAYARLNYAPGDFPITENVAREIVSLPMFPTLTAKQQARVADSVLRFANGANSANTADKVRRMAAMNCAD
jgi:dTDP-4-amino-4,6-dideoxygalactose transaminase